MSFPGRRAERHLARLVFTAFLATFLASRILVVLIITRRIPDLYVHVGGTHMHHLNFGIFILSIVGAILLFAPPTGRTLSVAAFTYGVGLALTFDEFGMWFHLGGSYWQRASFDAVIIVTGALFLIAFAPRLRDLRMRHWVTGIILAATCLILGLLMESRLRDIGKRVGPRIRELEDAGPR